MLRPIRDANQALRATGVPITPRHRSRPRNGRSANGHRAMARRTRSATSRRPPLRGHYLAMAKFANHLQSLCLNGGGGGNRKHRISSRFRQLRVITGNRILSYRKRKTAKSMFGKTLCQLAKSNAIPRREGRTWETCPSPRPWGRSRARSCRALGMQTHESWRALCCGSWHK